MGLNMYLSGRRYVSGHFNKGDDALAENIQKLLPELGNFPGSQGNRCIKEIQIEVGYWRKANHIHKWFVDNVQAGLDECNPHSVTRADLMELRRACEQVQSNHSNAASWLPTQSGFFFGGTDYDGWYFEDINTTIEIIDRALSLPNSWMFEYSSSW